MTDKIKIMLVEDSPAYRTVIECTFSNETELELISQFASAEGALQTLQTPAPDTIPHVILLDLNLPGMSGIEALPAFKQQLPDTKVIVLTQSGRESDVLAAIQAGASGYLLKSASLQQLKEAIQNVVNGGASLDPEVALFILDSLRKSPPKAEPEKLLSPREIEILTLTGSGLLKKEIADKLDISHRTVATHIERIYQKLNVPNAPAAIHKAHHLGLFPRK
jgi:DNA-binding NarL/FixJ family response regulator